MPEEGRRSILLAVLGRWWDTPCITGRTNRYVLCLQRNALIRTALSSLLTPLAVEFRQYGVGWAIECCCKSKEGKQLNLSITGGRLAEQTRVMPSTIPTSWDVTLIGDALRYICVCTTVLLL